MFTKNQNFIKSRCFTCQGLLNPKIEYKRKPSVRRRHQFSSSMLIENYEILSTFEIHAYEVVHT